MDFDSLMLRLESMDSVEGDYCVSANKINGVSVLIFKDTNGIIRECIVLNDESENPPKIMRKD